VNIYLAVILISLIGSWLLGLLSNFLNGRNLHPELPSEFADTFDAGTYRKSQEYARATMRFSNISDTFNTAVTVMVILYGGFNWLDQIIRSYDLSPIPTGLAYIAALGIASSILSLPFEAYQTFVLEKRFNFNTTTVGTFIADRVKGLVLTAIIGGILLSGVLYFFDELGKFAWLWCWGMVVTFTLAFTYVAPSWILPLFNKFTPLEDNELRRAIESYARKVGFRLRGIFVMDGSKRSTKSNAFFTGFGKNRRIALFDTLIKEQTTDEIVAVLAHEVGHSKRGHIRRQMILGFIKTGVIFYLMSLFLSSPGLFEAFGMDHMSIYAGLVFFLLLYTPLSLLLSIVTNAISRKHEFEADAYAAKTTENPQAMISALKKLSADNLSNLTPHRLTVWLEYGHPPVLQRIRALSTH